LANEVLVMRNGEIVERGDAADIFDHPKTDYTKALMAAAFDLQTVAKEAVNQ
jgi:microcin C transport system ATP-binding protein